MWLPEDVEEEQGAVLMGYKQNGACDSVGKRKEIEYVSTASE